MLRTFLYVLAVLALFLIPDRLNFDEYSYNLFIKYFDKTNFTISKPSYEELYRYISCQSKEIESLKNFVNLDLKSKSINAVLYFQYDDLFNRAGILYVKDLNIKVKKGDIVISQDNGVYKLIGIISKISEKILKLELSNSKKFAVGVINNRNKMRYVAKGDNQNLEIFYHDKEEIKIGDDLILDCPYEFPVLVGRVIFTEGKIIAKPEPIKERYVKIITSE